MIFIKCNEDDSYDLVLIVKERKNEKRRYLQNFKYNFVSYNELLYE